MKPQRVSMTKNFGGLQYKLDQIYWNEKWAQADAANSRKHGWYCRIVPVMHDGEIKHALYIREIKKTRRYNQGDIGEGTQTDEICRCLIR